MSTIDSASHVPTTPQTTTTASSSAKTKLQEAQEALERLRNALLECQSLAFQIPEEEQRAYKQELGEIGTRITTIFSSTIAVTPSAPAEIPAAPAMEEAAPPPPPPLPTDIPMLSSTAPEIVIKKKKGSSPTEAPSTPSFSAATASAQDTSASQQPKTDLLAELKSRQARGTSTPARRVDRDVNANPNVTQTDPRKKLSEDLQKQIKGGKPSRPALADTKMKAALEYAAKAAKAKKEAAKRAAAPMTAASKSSSKTPSPTASSASPKTSGPSALRIDTSTLARVLNKPRTNSTGSSASPNPTSSLTSPPPSQFGLRKTGRKLS